MAHQVDVYRAASVDLTDLQGALRRSEGVPADGQTVWDRLQDANQGLEAARVEQEEQRQLMTQLKARLFHPDRLFCPFYFLMLVLSLLGTTKIQSSASYAALEHIVLFGLHPCVKQSPLGGLLQKGWISLGADRVTGFGRRITRRCRRRCSRASWSRRCCVRRPLRCAPT